MRNIAFSGSTTRRHGAAFTIAALAASLMLSSLVSSAAQAQLGRRFGGGRLGGMRGGGAGTGQQQRAQELKKVLASLNLTADQKTKIQGFFGDERKQVMTLRQNTSLTDDQKKQQIRDLTISTMVKVKGILTPDQQKKLADELKKLKDSHAAAQKTGTGTSGSSTPAASGSGAEDLEF